MVFFYCRKEELSFNAMKKTKQVLSYILSEQRQRTKRLRPLEAKTNATSRKAKSNADF